MRSYGGEPARERQGRRRAALIDAATELIAAGERLTVRGACRSAQLNDRYFYESFATVDELLTAAFDQAIGATLTVLAEATAAAEGDLADRARSTVSTTLAHLVDNSATTRVMLEGRTNPVLAERRAQLVDTVVTMFVAATLARQTADLSPTMRRLAGLTLVNGALETTCLWILGTVDATRDELIDHLVSAIVGAVGAGTPAGQR